MGKIKLILGASILLFGSVANAAILLVEFESSGSGSSYVAAGFPKPIGLAFGLSYPGEFGIGVGWDFVFPFVSDPVEADKFSVTGEATFNALNSRDWDITIPRLTNGIDETLSKGYLVVKPSGELGGGGGGGNQESRWFGTPTDLIGSNIEFIIARPNAIVSLFDCDAELCLSRRVSYSVEWEIYGTNPACPEFPGGGATEGCFPGPSPVPIPATIWLFGTGILGLIGFSKRKLKAA